MTDRDTRGNRILGLFLPEEFDFDAMLYEQSERTLAGVEAFVEWLKAGETGDSAALDRIEGEVDQLRHQMEDKLDEAFSTPFDRQDLYSLSRNMDYVLNFTASTAREMAVFEVAPDDTIFAMSQALLDGTRHLVSAVKAMRGHRKGGNIHEQILRVREASHRVDEEYIIGMDRAFRGEDAMAALKKREIYHHLRDAGRALRGATDNLHRCVVGLA